MNPALLGSFAGLARNLGSPVQHAAASTPTPQPAPGPAADHADVLHGNPQPLGGSLEWFNPGSRNGIIIIGGKTLG